MSLALFQILNGDLKPLYFQNFFLTDCLNEKKFIDFVYKFDEYFATICEKSHLSQFDANENEQLTKDESETLKILSGFGYYLSDIENVFSDYEVY